MRIVFLRARGRACRSRGGLLQVKEAGTGVSGVETASADSSGPGSSAPSRLLQVPAHDVLLSGLAPRRIRRAQGEGAKNRIEINLQSQFWMLLASALAIAPATEYPPRCFQCHRRGRRMPGITPSSGGLPARRRGGGEKVLC